MPPFLRCVLLPVFFTVRLQADGIHDKKTLPPFYGAFCCFILLYTYFVKYLDKLG
jgi:hypothetical protein